jgi:hypothetical protein
MSRPWTRPTSLRPDDELELRWLIDVYGHIVDSGDWELLRGVFTETVEFDLSALGWGTFVGVDPLLARWRTIEHPVGHHMTNVVVLDATSGSTDEYLVRSKGVSVLADGRSRSNEYSDRVVRTMAGWRIARREVWSRSKPTSR